jgi:hypothetical protein
VGMIAIKSFRELNSRTSCLKISINQLYKSRDRSLGVATRLQAADRGCRVRFLAEAGNFSLYHRVQNDSGTHPASYPMGTGYVFPWGYSGRSVKLTTHLHLLPRLKNEWSYTFTPPLRLHCMVLIYSTGTTLVLPS